MPPDRLECLPYCLCDKKKVGFCLDRVTYNEKKILLRLFFSLQQQQGSVNAYVTVEDVMEWFFRQEKKMFKQWFPEIKEAENDQTWLSWVVNAHLRMQDIEQEVRRDLIARRQKGSELKDTLAPSDLESPDSAVPDFLMTSDDLRMPLVKRILRDLDLELQYYQCSRMCSRLEVVADIVTRLLFIMKTHPSGTTYNGTSMSLTELAMDIVRAVLRNLSSHLSMSSLQGHYSRLTAARMTQSVHQKLVKSLYTPDDMKHFLGTTNETLMASLTEHVSLRVAKLFHEQQTQPLEPPSILRLFMTASNHRSSPYTGQMLVIHNDTVTSVVTLVLLKLYSTEDTEYVFKPHNWPLVDHVVNCLSLSGMKVTKKKSKVNCYFNIHEVFCMVNSICEELLTLYDNMDSLMEALSYKNRMVSRDIGRQVSGQLQSVCQNKKNDRPRFEMPPCPDLENVICGVVARFVHILVPVTMVNKEDLLICLLLVDQIRYLTEVGFFQSGETSSIVCHLKELSSDMTDQLGDMVFSQYVEFYPLQDIQDQLHSLVMDKKQSFMISNMIITTMLDYVKLLQNISHEEYKAATSDALQPPPESSSPSAAIAAKPPPGFPLPKETAAVKPPPGFTVPAAATAVKPPPGFPVTMATTGIKPPPGFTAPTLKPPPGFGVPAATPTVGPPPGFCAPAATPTVGPPPGFPVPMATTGVKPPPGVPVPVATTGVKPPPGFPVPMVTTAVKPPPGFTVPVAAKAVKPPPGFPLRMAAMKPPPGFDVPSRTPAIKQPSELTAPDTITTMSPPPGFPVTDASAETKPLTEFTAPATKPAIPPVVKSPHGFAVPATTTTVKPPPGFDGPAATPTVGPPPGFDGPAATPTVGPPPGFGGPAATPSAAPPAKPAVKPPPELAAPTTAPAVKSSFELTLPDAAPTTVRPPPGFAVLDKSPAVKPLPELTAPDRIPTVHPPRGFPVLDTSTAAKSLPGLTAPDTKAVMMPPPGILFPCAPPPVKPPPGFAAPAITPAVMPPPGFNAPATAPVVKPPPDTIGPVPAAKPTVMSLSGFVFLDAPSTVKPPPGFLVPAAAPAAQSHPGPVLDTPVMRTPAEFTAPAGRPSVKPPPGFTVPVAASAVLLGSELTVLDTSPAVRPPPGFIVPDTTTALNLPPVLDTTPTLQPPAGFAVSDATPTAETLPGFPVPETAPGVKMPPGFNATVGTLVMPPHPGFAAPDPKPALQPPCGVLPECFQPELCLKVPDVEHQEKIEKIEHVSVENIALKVASDGSKDDHNQTPQQSKSVKPTKKKGVKGFLQKLRKSLRFWAPSSDATRQDTELCRNH